jgi:hypothetical protein
MIEESVKAGNLHRTNIDRHAMAVRRQPAKVTKVQPNVPFFDSFKIRSVIIGFNVCIIMTVLVVSIVRMQRPDDKVKGATAVAPHSGDKKTE